MGGQALSPPSSCECFVSHVKSKEFYRAKKQKTSFYSLEKAYAASINFFANASVK